MAVGADAVALVGFVFGARLVVLRLREALGERRQHAFEGTVLAAPGQDEIVLEAVHEIVAELRGQVLVGRREAHLVLLGDLLEERVVVHDGVVAGAPPGVDALAQRERLVGHDEVLVEIVDPAQSAARRAGAEGRVEREGARLQFGERDAAVRAGVEFRIGLRLAADLLHLEKALAFAERELDGVRQARPVAGEDEAVDDDLDRVVALLVQRGQFVRRVDRPVDAHAGEAVALGRGQDVVVAALLAAHGGSVEDDLAGRERLDGLDDLLGRLAVDFASADGAVGHGDGAVQEAQVVVDFGDRRDDRARIARGRVLLDGDRRRETLDLLHVRLAQTVQELPRVGGKRLDVAPLALCVKRVEGERGLATAREARDDRQGVPGYRHVHAAQVVFARALDDYVAGHGRLTAAGCAGRARAGIRDWTSSSSANSGRSSSRSRDRLRTGRGGCPTSSRAPSPRGGGLRGACPI